MPAKKKARKKTARRKAAKKRPRKKTAKKKARKKTAKKKARKKTAKKKARKKTAKKKARKKTAKKKARKKTAKKKARKKTAKKKTRKKSKRKPSAAFMKPMTPSAALAAVVGPRPMPRTQVTKKLWDYIKKNGLQDRINRRMINADGKLRVVFGGRSKVSMFEMTKLVSRHLS
jgi:upstream activation factor subunit UAF30